MQKRNVYRGQRQNQEAEQRRGDLELKGNKLITDTSSLWMRKLKLIEPLRLMHAKVRVKPFLNKTLFLTVNHCVASITSHPGRVAIPCEVTNIPVPVHLKQPSLILIVIPW